MRGAPTIKVKSFVVFGVVLAFACGLQFVLFSQFATMAGLNRDLSATVLPGVAAATRLDDAIANLQMLDAQHLLSADPAIKSDTGNSLPRMKRTIAADLKKLDGLADTDMERRIAASLDRQLSRLFAANDDFVSLSDTHEFGRARALFSGDLYNRFAQADSLVDRFVAVNDAKGEATALKGAAMQKRSTAVILTTVLFSIGVTIAVFWALTKILIDPLRRMTEAMEKLAAGNLDTRVPALWRRDEIGRLARAMAHFKTSAMALRDAKNEADAGTRAKSAFLANMSHELRTPLNAIIGFSDLMLTQQLGPLGNSRYREYIDDIHGSGLQLLALINDLLDLSRIGAGEETLFEEDVSVRRVISDACRMIELQAKQSNVTVVTRLSPNLPEIRGDERRIKQIVLNLLTNAIKFTPAFGTVTVAAGQSTGGLFIEVRDTGIGIAEVDMPKVLERFGQVDNKHSRRHSGTGLGLPLVKELIELHGGSLRMESKVDVGTGVTVTFPLTRVVAAAGVVAA
jgi:signal transduction histidine kinase